MRRDDLRDARELAASGHASGPDAPLRATGAALARARHARSVVLVEGISDQIAVETLAGLHGRDLTKEAAVVVPVGGAHSVGRFLDLFGPGAAGCVSAACATPPRSRMSVEPWRAPDTPNPPRAPTWSGRASTSVTATSRTNSSAPSALRPWRLYWPIRGTWAPFAPFRSRRPGGAPPSRIRSVGSWAQAHGASCAMPACSSAPSICSTSPDRSGIS